jgi:hypothetical protein
MYIVLIIVAVLIGLGVFGVLKARGRETDPDLIDHHYFREQHRRAREPLAARPVDGEPLSASPPAGDSVAAPSVATTIWITLIFGIFGIIPAAIHSEQARTLGEPPGGYWFAFAATLIIWLIVGPMLLLRFFTLVQSTV